MELPWATITIATLMLASYLFTYQNINYYKCILGFKPSSPSIYSPFTYMFVHKNLFHLIGNLGMFILLGYIVEEAVGKKGLVTVFFFSGFVSLLFDVLGRILLGIRMNVPFIGASCGIFGLLAVASLIRPTRKIPTFLLFVSFLPLLQLFVTLPIFLDFMVQITVLSLTVILVIILLIVLPKYTPLFISSSIFIVSWAIFLILMIPTSVSNVGHLGGFVGGILFILLSGRKKRIYSEPSNIYS